MRKIIFAFCILLCLLSVRAEEALSLVQEGRPCASIVIGEKPTRAARFAAAELQHVIKLVSGATLPVVAARPADGAALFVGCGLDETFGGEDYAVRFKGRDVFLCGNDAPDFGPFDYADVRTFPAKEYCLRATTYAVYDFLEKCIGVRFYSFGDDGIAFVPQPTLDVAPCADVRRHPFMPAYRHVYFSNRPEKLGIAARDNHLLHLRWRMNTLYGSVNHSVMGIWARYYKKAKGSAGDLFIESRPDYFAAGYKGKHCNGSLRALYPGDPDYPPQLCTSSDGPVEYFADEAVRLYHGEKIPLCYAARPVMPGFPYYYPVEEDDGGGWCKCARCSDNSVLKNYGYKHFDWINRIARKLAAREPKIGVSTLAYGDTIDCPDGLPLEKNVLVQMCLGPQSWFHPYTYRAQHDAYRKWVDREGKNRPLTLWLYYLCPWAEATGIHRYGAYFPVMFPHHNGRFFKEFAADGIQGFFAEIQPKSYLLEAYLAAKIADDPSVDPDALLDEFYARYFGAAGTAMKRFCETLEKESYDIANYSPAVQAMRETDSYIYRLHRERDNWYLGSAERVARLDKLVSAARAAAVTPLEKRRTDRFTDWIWGGVVEGRRAFEERERVRAIPLPRTTAVWEGSETAWSTPFRSLRNEPVPYEARVALSTDGECLTVRYAENDGAAAAHDEDLWSNGLEGFLAVKNEPSEYLQFVVSPKGELRFFRVTETAGAVNRTEEKIDGRIKTKADGKGWTLSVSLPLARLPGKRDDAKGGYLFANFLRTRRFRDGTGVSSAWSPIFVDGYLDGLHRLGTVSVAEKPVSRQIAFPTSLTVGPTPAWHFGEDCAPAAPGSTVTFSFEARSDKATRARLGLNGWCGRGYHAGLAPTDVPVGPTWQTQTVTLTARTLQKESPLTRLAPAFGCVDGEPVEFRNIHIELAAPGCGKDQK